MPIDLYPNIAKVKRGGVYQNLPGFVQQSSDADIKAMIANSESSTTAQYAHPEGSYFILNDILYKAIIDIAVNDTIAVGTNCEVAILCNDISGIENDVDDLKYAISDTVYQKDVLFSIIANEYVKRENGSFLSYPNWSRTDYIDCSDYVSVISNKASTYSAFYDSDHNFIMDIVIVANTALSIPKGAKYLCISNSTADMQALTITANINGLEKKIEFLTEDSTIYPESIVQNGYIDKNGNFQGTPVYVCTPFIKLPFNEKQPFFVHCCVNANAGFAVYDINKSLLLGVDSTNVANYGGSSNEKPQTLTLPYINGMAYIRMSYSTARYTALTDLWVNGNTVSGAFKRILNVEEDINSISSLTGSALPLAKTLVIGDSISADAYGSYPKWVTDLINAGTLSANTVNSSQHATGFVARYNNEANDFITRLKAIQDPETYDLVIVFGGINDYIQNIPMGSESGTDYTVSFKPAVNEFFDYLIQNFTQARLCVILPLRTYATWQNSEGEYQQAYGDYIKTVAKSYCLPILNLTEESGFCPYISAFSNMWTLLPEGYESHDGVHPNEEYEAKYLAPMIKAFLQTLI